MAAVEVPVDAPPLFVALAADDPLFPGNGFGLIENRKKASGRTALLRTGWPRLRDVPQSTTITGWFEPFASWMKMHGYMDEKGAHAGL